MTPFRRDLTAYKVKLEAEVKNELESGDVDKVILKLMELQHRVLTKVHPDALITALAQITISTVLKHLQVEISCLWRIELFFLGV